MTEIAQLFTGILLATAIFAATLFSAAQAYRQSGALQKTHLAAAILTIAAMACLSLQLWTLSQITGAALGVAALGCLILDKGWNRLLPLAHIAFATALALGLPFGR
jgi:hypothetical protein